MSEKYIRKTYHIPGSDPGLNALNAKSIVSLVGGHPELWIFGEATETVTADGRHIRTSSEAIDKKP